MNKNPFMYTLHQLKPHIRRRGKVLKDFSEKIGLAYLGSMHQHDDEYDAIRGFTASTSHRDSNYAVGTYESFDIRVVNRFDVQKQHVNKSSRKITPMAWVVLEFTLKNLDDAPHVFFVPTGGPHSSAYEKVFTANIHMQPLNNTLNQANHSTSLYGKYQILSRPTHAGRVAELLTDPVVFGIGEKLWPQGLEIYKNKLYIYISEENITSSILDTACVSGLWLAKELS